MNKYLIRGALLSVGLISACAGSESASDADGVKIARAEESLFLEGTTWPHGTVPVCWTAKSTSRGDFAALSAHVRNVLLSTWPRVANIEFTGWAACPSNTAGMVVINLNDDFAGNANVGYGGSNFTSTVNLGVLRGDFFGSLVPHEFGHVLGFGHEMDRPDFNGDAAGDCTAGNSSGDNLGTPSDRQSIMASTGYCQENPLLSRWDIVGARNAYGARIDNVVSTGSDLYARKVSNGDFYKRTGSSWTRIGSPGGQFVVVGSALYGLSPDSADVNQYAGSGTDWTKIGGVAHDIFRCGTMLCGTHPDDLALYRLNGNNWERIGDIAAEYASTANDLYRLTLDRSAVEKFDDSTDTWTQVGGAASALYATQSTVFAVKPSTGDLYRYNGTGTSWSFTGGPGDTWVGVGNTLYGLTPSRDGVWKWSGSGSSWTKVGTAADWIYGGASGSLYATNPDTKTIMRYLGTNMDWVSVGQP